MQYNMSWPALVGVALAYYGTLALYRLFLHPLTRFPGPKLAACSRWYEGYYDVILGGQYTKKIAELHKIYGPIIRISPHELHVIDPAFFKNLYRTDGRWYKYSWSTSAFGAPTSTLFGSDHDAHKSRRRAIAPYFSRPNIIARQDIIDKHINKLCQRVNEHVGTTVNLGAAISAFTRDTANEFIIGKAYNDLDLPDFNFALSVQSQGMGSFWRITKHIRWFGPTIRAMPIPLVMKIADEGTVSFLGMLQSSENDTRAALTTAKSASPNNTPSTMVHAIVQSDLPPSEKALERVFEEVATITGAGFETTGSALRLILFHIFSDADILRQIRDELSLASTNSSEPLPLKTLEQLPYLTAVITEGLRLSPAIATRMARVSDRALVYGNWHIPAGTPVGMTTLLMHTDENLYPEPMRFNPDRWLGEDANAASASTYAPFGRGTRICLGMHLAWAEMYLLLAALVRKFDFDVEGAVAGDFELERDNFAIETKAGVNLKARVAVRGSER
ncbi:trichodiene oxygenase [Ophiobolus disseminans]|uniref:Trichodiene oxygenase n=1 Tax=Ophiobolus disseminans TaxID=1469910 RepID=A0A6A6ZMN5_9PLEO|nr:trichodiene oxygenase [Ophiobolus disseminans]